MWDVGCGFGYMDIYVLRFLCLFVWCWCYCCSWYLSFIFVSIFFYLCAYMFRYMRVNLELWKRFFCYCFVCCCFFAHVFKNTKHYFQRTFAGSAATVCTWCFCCCFCLFVCLFVLFAAVVVAIFISYLRKNRAWELFWIKIVFLVKKK